MNVSGEESIYYQIVFEAQQAIDSLNQLDAAGAEFKNTLAQLKQSFVDIAGAGGNVEAVADSLKRVNADVLSANEERIRATVAGEGNIQAALEASRAKYIEVDAAINKLAADTKVAQTAQTEPALVEVGIPISPAAALAAKGEDVSASVQSLRSLIATGADLDAVEKMAQSDMAALAEQYNVDAPAMANAMKNALNDMSVAEKKRIEDSLTGEDNIRVALAQEAEQRKALANIIDAAAKNLAPTTVPAIAPEVLESYRLLVGDVQKATLAMTEMQAAGKSNGEIQAAMGEAMASLSSQYKVNIPIIADMFKQMGVNVKLTDDDITAMANKAALAQIKADADGAAKALKGGADAGREFENVLRMIEGVAIAMVIFQVFQTISQAIQGAMDNANKYYQSLQNIIVAQDTLARSGVSTTNQQLLDMADQLHEKFQRISQVDMVQVVSQAALLTANYGFSVQQIQQLSQQAAILHYLDPSKDAVEYVAQLVKALEGSRSLAANNAQVAITAAEILAKAKELNLVSADTKSITDDHVKMTAALAIEQERLVPEAQALAKTNDSIVANTEAMNAKWQDVSKSIGTIIDPFLNTFHKLIISILQILQDNINQALQVTISLFAAIDAEITVYAKTWEAIKAASQGHFEQIQQLPNIWNDAYNAAQKYLTLQFSTGGLDLSKNTPTSSVSPSGTTQGPNLDTSKINSMLDSVAKDYQSYYDGVQKAQENFNTKMQDLQDQYNLNVQKEIENTNLRMAEEKQNYRLKELKAEEDFQQKMRDLTARYLLDLEDALRKRDAEAVIKTIERYNMEKNSAQQQEDLRISQDKKAEELRLSQMKQEEELRLKQMADEYALQQQKAKAAYDQQLADLQASLKSKLEEEAVKIAQEFGMNQTGMEALLSLFNQYYGPDGQFAQSQQGSYLKMIEQSGAFVAQMEAIISQYFQTMGAMSAMMPGMTGPVVGSTNSGYYRGGGGTTQTPLEVPGNITVTPPSGGMTVPHGQAAGGMALAASATDVTFGEAGPELAMFLPLNSSTSIPALGTTLGAGGQFGGQAVIALQVDPNLEARIVNTTLTHAAISIEKVYRTG